MRALQRLLQHRYAGRGVPCPVRWLVWASDAPAAWSLGGDLALFAEIIRRGEASRLRDYAHLAIDILHDNHVGMGLPLLTVALVQGDAIGGGLEAMLTHDLTVAESQARFGLPEILFDLFPGMGAYSFLKRRLGARAARAMIEDGQTHDAASLAARGLIDVVCAQGDGEPAVRQLIARNEERLPLLRTLKKVRERVDPVHKAELLDVVDLWVEHAFSAGEPALRRMDCLARVQHRKRALPQSLDDQASA
jgi:DSF synthase